MQHFGENNSIVGDFMVPLQMVSGARNLPKLKDNQIISFIQNYRKSLSETLENDHQFTAKFFVMLKLGNHKSSSDYAIEFVRTKDLSAEDRINIQNLMVGIKEKEVEKRKYLPNEIIKEMGKLGYQITISQHTRLWQGFDAKKPDKKFGVQVSKTWYWYDSWIQKLTQHYKSQNN